MKIAEWIKDATSELKQAGIESARLDAELILAHTLRKPRIYLHANDYLPITDRQEDIANARVQLRLEHTPIAYIVGHKEFYGRSFKTTPAALIPRPESEAIIELLGTVVPKNLSLLPDKLRLVDIGTGTGILGITAKLEWPELDVTLIDISNHALSLAKENAQALHAHVKFLRGDLLRGYASPVDIILANLPYVDRGWQVSADAHAEPELALYADDHGLSLIRELVGQAELLLKKGGSMLLESDVRQHAAVIALAEQHGFKHTHTEGLITLFTHK
jgi:release factor glutamine methyltransferase